MAKNRDVCIKYIAFYICFSCIVLTSWEIDLLCERNFFNTQSLSIAGGTYDNSRVSGIPSVLDAFLRCNNSESVADAELLEELQLSFHNARHTPSRLS